MVYGYASVQHDDEAEITELHDRLTVYAEAEGLALIEVYVDRNVRPGRVVRPGLTVLMEAVARAGGCGVVVPTLNHLSPSRAVLEVVEGEIEILGGWIVVEAEDDIAASVD